MTLRPPLLPVHRARAMVGLCLSWGWLGPATAADLVGVGMSDVNGEAATHTHSGPGGYSHDLPHNLTGTFRAINRAHDSRAPGAVRYQQGELLTVSRHRSAPAFRANAAPSRSIDFH